MSDKPRPRNCILYDDGDYVIRRKNNYRGSLQVTGDYYFYPVVEWQVCRWAEYKGYLYLSYVKVFEDDAYPIASTDSRRAITKRMKGKCLKWLERHKAILASPQDRLVCHDIDGLGTHCPALKMEGYKCTVKFTRYGYTGGGNFERPAPGVCDGASGYSPPLPGGLGYYWNIIRAKTGKSHRTV